MKGKICLTGDSLEVKLLRDSLLERELEVLFFKKSEFDLQKTPLIHRCNGLRTFL